MTRYVAIFCACILSLLPLSLLAQEKPTVIAISAIADLSSQCPGVSHDIMAVRDKVVSDLVREYDCVVLGRANGFTFATEKELNNLKTSIAACGADLQNSSIPAADYAITGYFKIARRSLGTKNKVDLGCTLIFTDLKEEGRADFKKIDFIPDEDSNFSHQVTAEIAKELKLKQRQKNSADKLPEKIKQIWAVMPLSRLDSEKAMVGPPDSSLSTSIELALQSSGTLDKIVDRRQIESIFKEMKIESICGATEGMAGKIASILGADRVIMGTVSRDHRKKNDLRLDLILVDAKNSVVLDAAKAVVDPKQIETATGELTISLLRSDRILPSLPPASKEIRSKEAKLYNDLSKSLLNGLRESYLEYVLVNSFTESSFMLVFDIPDERYALAETVMKYVRRGSREKNPKPKREKIAEIVEKIAGDDSMFPADKHPLLLCAGAWNAADEYRRSIELVNQHLRIKPTVNTYYSNLLLVINHYEMKEYEKALPFAEKISNTQVGASWLAKIHHELGNEKEELKYLKELNFSNRGYNIQGELPIRYLALLRKFEGAKKCISTYERFHSWIQIRPETKLELAKAFIEISEKGKAAVILDEISQENTMQESMYYPSDKKMLEKLKTDIAELKKSVADIKISWKTLRETNQIPRKYKIYLQPIGNPDFNLIIPAVFIAEDFLGCKIEILPVIPIPDDPSAFVKSRGQYDAPIVADRIARVKSIPEDAIYELNITDKDIFSDDLRFIYSNYRGNGHLSSYHYFFGAGNDNVLIDMIAKTISGSAETAIEQHLYHKNNKTRYDCKNTICLFSPDSSAWGMRDKKFAACEECQKYLKQCKWDEFFKYWHNRIELDEIRAPEEKKWIEDYRLKVNDALKKAEEEKAKISLEKVDFLPAVDIPSPAPGLSCKYYEFETDAVKDTTALAKLSPIKTLIAPAISTESAARQENFGLEFSGFIKVPADDVYSFCLGSDDGSVLSVAGTKIIDNDGMHAPVSKIGTIALKAGLHPFKLSFMQGKGGHLLELRWRSENHIIGQKIPPEAFFNGDAESTR